jgi:hypothetical protein
MSFAPQFEHRWHNVVQPAIRSVQVGDTRLEPYRVDARHVNDSILTDILMGISNSRLIFVDISTIGEFDGTPIRNGNVMYELGLAHSARIAEEVLIFRSDDDRLLFDVANVRVHSFGPDTNPDDARRLLADALVNALREVDLRRHLAVRKAIQSLDASAWLLLCKADGAISPPVLRTMGDVVGNASSVSAIGRLLEIGVLSTEFPRFTAADLARLSNEPAELMMRYLVTPFGQAVKKAVLGDLGFYEREFQDYVRSSLDARE